MAEAAEALATEDDIFENSPMTATVVEPPDFEQMKVVALKEFVVETFTPDAAKPILKMKKAELIEYLKQTFPHPDALDTPEVTGFDPNNDPISQTVMEVQGLDSEQAAVNYVRVLADTNEFNFFRMGGALAEMLAKGWMSDCEDFGAFVVKEFGMGLRKAQSLIAIYHAVVSCGATWEDIQGIGWSKLSLIAASLTPGNYKEWFAKIADINYAATADLVKKLSGDSNSPPGADDVAESTPKKSLTFIVHEDQVPTIKSALGRAKEAGNTTYDGPALEWICIDYLNGSGGTGELLAKAAEDATVGSAINALVLAKDGDPMEALVATIEAVEESFAVAYPDLEISVNTEGTDETDDLAKDDG